MAKQFIHYITKNGIEYAYIYSPRKENGIKVNDPIYLGRVIDKSNGVFRSRMRGLFTFDFDQGYGIPSDTYMSELASPSAEEKLILDFGDAYCLYAAIKKCGLHGIIDSLLPTQTDTLMSLLGFKLLADASNLFAEDWWEGSYARILFPRARLQSQRISEFYRELGDETVHRAFFKRYLEFICKGRRVGVLIDSTGLPNDINFPLTAISTHNGIVSNETRLLMVVDRKSTMPLFFRYNAGNIVDVSTLRSTIFELEVVGIDTDFAILDAGYFSENNIQCLYGDGVLEKKIPFITRLGSNRKLFKQLVLDHVDDLAQSKYFVMQRERLLSIKRVKVDLFGNIGYAYIAIDHARREDEIYKFVKSALLNKDVSFEEIDLEMKSKGLFVLVSSEEIDTNELMPLYYTRQIVEQIFDTSKNNADLLPLRVHSEDTFRGHLLLSFISTVIYLTINQLLESTDYHAKAAFLILRNQKCKVFADRILPKEPTKKMNDIYKSLGFYPPSFVSICGGNN